MRQLAMVIDLNKCIGCQTCTLACKSQWTDRGGREFMYWNHVETEPGKGYPRDWKNAGGGWEGEQLRPGRLPRLHEDYGYPAEFNYEEALFEPTEKPLRPIQEMQWGPNWEEDQGAGEFPNSYFFYLPRLCNHCTKPACLAACPRQAIYKREEDGIVLIDQDRCRGYRYCVAACPYKKIYFNPTTGMSEKCIFCYPRVERGTPPACAYQCVGRARHVSYLDDREGPVHRLVNEWKVALPLLPQHGTQPNVYYVPPLSPPAFDADGRPGDKPRLPENYLEELFGPGVHDALATLEAEIERKGRGEASEVLDILIAYRHGDMFRLDRGGQQGGQGDA
ncbi:respiratory nitrate reductase subunit beta [Thioalkalivibrio denitrificans]|uniref:Respiratory nitrate reductase subunit beta n=1 Tax=Thioalkalivibrio denitrificans TaxID=108003 RepID=A0A1V3NRN0_9GAMM|nr:4Fe-4S dicluster domain-containing protein [Thioalkalivibrio denitrificans]OOG27710.1 respiratory nitrate reductase subunit beta [Thioalkalivibrio denitrificans]